MAEIGGAEKSAGRRADGAGLLDRAADLRRQGRNDEAAAIYRNLVVSRPDHPAAYLHLAQMLMASAPEAARNLLDQGVRLRPEVAVMHALRGQSLLRLGEPAEAVVALDQTLALDPGLAPARSLLLRACREAGLWDREDALLAEVRNDLARAGSGLVLPVQTALCFPFDAAELKAIAATESHVRTAGLRPSQPPRVEGDGGPLVIGYLSPDFRDHAIAHLVGGIVAAHDRSRVKVVALSEGPCDGSVAEMRIRAGADAFIDLRGMGDVAAARRIADEGVQVLVDLALFTTHHRPGIPFLRPAPVQVAWLGLPTTTGAEWFDYALVDQVVAPSDHQDRFTERLVWLPHGYQPNSGQQEMPLSVTRAEAGLPADAFVFACFNSHLKIDRRSFAAWLDILRRVPGSLLWLLAPPAAVAANYRAAAQAQGIAPERLVFAGKLPRDRHLARLGLADLFLDTLIYGAHTTASDALRSGVPVVTVLGDCFAARVAASLLHTIGLPELVASSVADYGELAVGLANQPARLSALRDRLAVQCRTSPLFDPGRHARALEWAYARMWADHQAGRAPESFAVPAS